MTTYNQYSPTKKPLTQLKGLPMLESVSASEDETLITRFANLETPKFMVENKSISIKFTVEIEQKLALKFSLLKLTIFLHLKYL